jgi:hypothetical protein
MTFNFKMEGVDSSVKLWNFKTFAVVTTTS